MSAQPAIEARGLRRSYASDGVVTHAIREANLSVEQGQFVVISGPSGCGKSTLLSVLGLLEAPDAGTISMFGEPVYPGTDAKAAATRSSVISFVFQGFNLIPHVSVVDNVALPLEIAGIRGAKARGLAMAQLEALQISDQAAKFPEQLSGGQQQRVAIARALVTKPRILLADEPTGNLDSENSAKTMDLLKEANAKGATIVLVTHDPRYFDIGTTLLRMSDGILGQASTQS